MDRLFIIAETEQQGQDLQSELAAFKDTYEFVNVQTLTEAGKRMSKDVATLVVYAVPWVDEVIAKRVENFRAQNLEIPVVVIGKVDSTTATKALKQIPWVLHIDVPYSVTQLTSLVLGVLEHRDVRQAVHKRFPTQTKGWMEQGSRKIPVILENVSLGGALCTMKSLEPWAHGSTIFLRVNLNELGKERILKATIVWSKKNEEDTIQKVGIKFKVA